MNNYFTAPIGATVNLGHVVKSFCLPPKTACDETVIDGLFVDCNEQWNCNLPCATDQHYFIPVPENGSLMFQTNKRNVTVNTVKLFNIDRTENLSVFPIMVESKKGSQTFRIDFNDVPIDCGYFEINGVCTQQFKKLDCEKYIEIESIVKSKDCWNNDYSGMYSNKIYLEGMLKYYGIANGSAGAKEVARFIPSKLIPPFMAKYLALKILNQKKVIINGETWNTKETTLTPREKSNMFWPLIEFERTPCSTNGNCN